MRRVRSQKSNDQGVDVGFAKDRSIRKRSKWKRWLAVSGAITIGAIAAAPTVLLQQRAWLISQINRNSGLAPIQIDIGPLRGGWIQPFSAQGIRLVDDRGSEIVKIGSLDTELTLFSLVSNYRRLGTITLRDVAMAVDVHPGTTSLEEAIKPLMQSGREDQTAEGVSGSIGFTGRIRLAEAVVQVRDTVDQTAWALRVSEADVPIPTSEQPIPPMTLIGQLTQTMVLPGQPAATGQFTLRTEPIAPGMSALAAANLPSVRMTVSTQGLPLQWMSLVKRRLPDLPIDHLDGEATVMADVEYTGPQALTAFVKTAQVDRLRIAAPSLVGQRGAGIQQIRYSGDISLFQNRISTSSSKLECDFGTVISKANIAIPTKLPAWNAPWLEDSEFDIQGNIDLPKLSAVAPDLVQMQDQVTLLQGNASLVLSQSRPASLLATANPSSNATSLNVSNSTASKGIPSSSYQVKLGNLQANMRGKRIVWEEAFSAGLDVSGNAQGVPSLRLFCNSEFCQIEGSGDLLDGRLTAQLDLDKMEQRLSEWFVLPLESLTGSAQAALAWKLDEGNRLAASGSLRTTPLRIVHAKGMLDEPAWDGDFTTIAQLDGMTIMQLDRIQANLRSPQESLEFQVLEPVVFSDASISSTVPSGGTSLGQTPAPMVFKLNGDLDRWQRRGQMFAGVDPGVALMGKVSLDVQGAIDRQHVEVSSVDWIAEPFQITSGSSALQESRMVGKFQGNFDSSKLANLRVDNLLVRADSFAIQAQDQAVGQEGNRKGQGAFRIDPSRLIASIQSEPAAGSSQPIRLTGDVTGQMDWTLNPSDIQWHLVTQAKDLRAVQPTVQPRNPNQLVSTGAAASNEFVLWEEPQAVVTLDGNYRFSDGLLQLPQVLMQTEWLAYGGATQVTQQGDTTIVQSQGSLTYDAARAAERLRPYTGGMLTATGQKTQPLEVTWVNAPNHKWTEAFSANSSVGWDSANVVGIDIGGAEIPVVIENGRFASKAEFPVSQGMLRWNLDGDFVAEPMVIRQTQQRVIENVAITRQMCQGWLKYVTPLLADVTSVQGNLTLDIDRAEIFPTESFRQTVEGRLHVHGANVGPGPLADQILNLVTQIRNLRRGAGATDGGGQASSWLQLPEQNIAFAVDRGRVMHRDMKIQAGDVLLTTSGSVGLDGSLELVAAVPILKEWVDRTPALQPLAGQMIQIPIRGTVSRPQLDSSGMIQLGQQLATSALAGAAQKQIDKGLGKLLGPLQQGGSQLPLPNLPSIPGIPGLQIPGFGSNPFGPAPSSAAPSIPAPGGVGAPAGGPIGANQGNGRPALPLPPGN
ncbi:MAG: hypothetical protein ACK449_12305 [Planctomycetota bacterium]|jgi:translocation and assembly module TamB